jgi:hypothetical protein
MNGWVDAPPSRKRSGCFARGCLILVVFAVVLGIACFAGMYWGLHRHSAIFHGLYWLTKAQAIGQTPVPIPQFTASDTQIQSVHERCEDFEQKARAGQAAELELTPDDINTLIAANQDARGKVFVSIDGVRLRCQASVPLGEFIGRSGYYFNGDIAVELENAESVENPQLNRIIVNGEPVPSDLLNWKYRSKRLRDYLVEYRNDSGVGTIAIRDGKLILRSRSE